MISENRHQAQRIKAKRKADHYTGLTPARSPKAYKTPTPCSCWMCGNPRKYFGNVTVQERSFAQTQGW